MASRYEVKTDTAGTYRWVLYSPENRVLARSPSYERKADALASIDMVRREVPDATVVEV